MSLARQQLLGAPGNGSPSPPPPGMRADPNMVPMPNLNAALDALTNEQLETLVSDSDAFKQFMIKLESETQASKTLRDIASRNRTLAQENLDMQASIEEARNHVAVVKSSEFTGARSGFAELQARQAAVTEQLGTQKLLSLLVRDAEQADNKSGALQDAFLGGELTADAFVEQYLTQRTGFHMLDIRRQVAEFSMT